MSARRTLNDAAFRRATALDLDRFRRHGPHVGKLHLHDRRDPDRQARGRALPDWVLDYLLVHELAHLEHSDHGPAFHELVEPLPADRAGAGLPDGDGRRVRLLGAKTARIRALNGRTRPRVRRSSSSEG